MKTFVALLRGINVGGKNILPMKEFRAMLTSLGCEDVATYIQSGNAVFRSASDAAELSEALSARIHSKFGFRPVVMLLPATNFAAIAAANPFDSDEVNKKFLHIWFLREPARKVNRSRLEEAAVVGEEFVLTKSAFYLCAPDGIGRSKLAADVKKYLGVQATARNCRTVGKIGELLDALV
ncbi:MAG: DUF1697 domain-containing protein [Woeseiaceae bacterium]|nr:DUF1697 domain-containing protein [Woeseiaceae bacterium]